MRSPLLDLDLTLLHRRNIGLVEIHGALTGEKKASLRSKCTQTTWPLKPIALQVFQPSQKQMESIKFQNSFIEI